MTAEVRYPTVDSTVRDPRLASDLPDIFWGWGSGTGSSGRAMQDAYKLYNYYSSTIFTVLFSVLGQSHCTLHVILVHTGIF